MPSTGTGPYNEQLDPITVDEWWLLAKNDVMEMTKRGVPGVWTYGFYDGWVPNYMFFIAHSHNAVGRFYEVQSYGPDPYDVRPGATTTSKEWFRPNPPLAEIKWGPRNNTNIQESALLFALNHVAKNRELYLENYWLKNKRAVDKGKNGPVYGWVVPASQRAKYNAADMVNELKKQGAEIHTANAAFKAGNVQVEAGDWVIRGDQPYRTLVDMYTAIQNYSPSNPLPYDDTGWTMQLMRNVKLLSVTDKSLLEQPMTAMTANAKPAGGIDGTGSTLVIDHTTDNSLVTLRFKHAGVKMSAAEEDFEAGGRKFHAGSFIIANPDRAVLEPTLKDLSLTALAVAAAPAVKTHDLDVPRIGYVHSWVRTQDEGWVRAAFDHFAVPYTYFSDIKLRDGGLRSKYDVIVFPHIGGTSQSQVNGLSGGEAVPYKKSELTPNLGAQDSADDIRGGMGMEGLLELAKFVREGGTLIVEGSTVTIFPDYAITSGVTVETPAQLFVRGSIMRGVFSDRKSPIAYGYDAQVPVYFNQGPVLNVGGGFGGIRRLWIRRWTGRRRTEHHADGDALAAVGLGSGTGDAEAGAPAGRRDGAVPPDGAAVRHRLRRGRAPRGHALPAESQRHAAVGHVGWRTSARQPRTDRRCAARQGPCRDVRHAPVLALAVAGDLLPRLQRDSELERSGRRQTGQDGDEPAAAVGSGSGIRDQGSGIRVRTINGCRQ